MLLKWEPDKEGPRRIERTRGYELGSSFAVRCETDRVKRLQAIIGAKDPYIRVAGAVYLCFEDEATGKAELTKLMKLPGEPGGWAALTLARRGDKEALPRALELLQGAEGDEAFGRGWHTESFQNQLRVLLSNSAKASGVPQPAFQRWARTGEDEFKALTQWWETHSSKLTLRDPWMELLAKQKID